MEGNEERKEGKEGKNTREEWEERWRTASGKETSRNERWKEKEEEMVERT